MKVFLSTADASGDLHAAALVEALGKRWPELRVFGLGGERLAAQGVELVEHQSTLAIGGLLEVVSSTREIARGYARLRRALLRGRPDVAVLVDSPDLNLPLASVARRAGIPVFYYVAPQVWAWRRGRLRKIRRRVDHLGVIFPFEEAYFRAAGIPATFVGHPLVDRMAEVRSRVRPAEVARKLGLDPGRPLLCLLPGSRRNELDRNLPLMLETAERLHGLRPELQIRLLLAPTLAARELAVPPHVGLVRGRTHEAMAISRCLLAAPGTVTVEAALLGVPLVVAHRGQRLSFEIVRRLTRVSSTCMVNLIANEDVVPERLQDQARPGALAALVSELLRDGARRERMLRGLRRAAERLGPAGAAERAADLVLQVAGRK